MVTLAELKIGQIILVQYVTTPGLWPGTIYEFFAEIINIKPEEIYPLYCLIPKEFPRGWLAINWSPIKEYPHCKLLQHKVWEVSLKEVIQVFPEMRW